MKSTLKIAIILILAIAGAFYISIQKSEVLVIEVTLARPPDDDSARIISQVDASISYAKRMEVPRETLLSTPGITVLVIQNMKRMSGWYSIPIPSEGSIYGRYNITVKPDDTFDSTQPFRILTRVVDPNGNDVSVKAVDFKHAK